MRAVSEPFAATVTEYQSSSPEQMARFGTLPRETALAAVRVSFGSLASSRQVPPVDPCVEHHGVAADGATVSAATSFCAHGSSSVHSFHLSARPVCCAKVFHFAY